MYGQNGNIIPAASSWIYSLQPSQASPGQTQTRPANDLQLLALHLSRPNCRLQQKQQ